MEIATGQPLALDLLSGLLQICGDIVPTGIAETIPSSGVWHKVPVAERPPLELLTWDKPWGSGQKDPATLMQLAEEDVRAGFAECLPGGLSEAAKRFGAACAAGRLELVKKDGAAPRLVGDSTISNANRLCRIAERIELPTLQDVAAFCSLYPHTAWSGFLLDVS